MAAVELARAPQKFLDKTSPPLRARIVTRLVRLGTEPVPRDAKFLGRDEEGDRCFRIRVGAYRAIYVLLADGRVLVTVIDKRELVYYS